MNKMIKLKLSIWSGQLMTAKSFASKETVNGRW